MVLKDPKYIEIPSRNLIADQVELTVDGNFFDGMVLLSTCDSIVPGHLMGCARLDIPAIVVTGGYMPLGTFRGKEVVHIRAQDKVGAMAEGKIDPDLYNGLIQHSWGICGGCTSMTTANSMCMMAEAMGMTLPGNSSMSAVSSEIRNLSYRAGLRIMEMVRQGITARQIITPESIRNAIAVDMAVAGSSNLILHLPAIAHEAGYDEPWWKVFDEMSNTVPLLSHLMPGGEYSVKDFDLAGGMPALMKNLLPRLNGDCMTVNGHTVRENVENAVVYNDDVHPYAGQSCHDRAWPGRAVWQSRSRGVHYQNCGGSQAAYALQGQGQGVQFPARRLEALRAGRIHEGDACVLRFMGLKGRFGTTAFTFQEELKGKPALYNSCAIITDGRFSGGTSGLSVGYVSPEAALCSPLSIVEDNDEIEIDIPARSITLCISDEELNARLEKFKWEFSGKDYQRFLRLFSRNVGSMAKGGIWEV